LENIIDTLSAGLISYITLILRFVTPILSGVILYRCGRSFLSGRAEDETWGYLCMPNGGRIPLNHWENIIGRNRSCDALMEYPTVSRNHGALIRDSRGRWKVYDLNSKSGILINGKKVVHSAPVKSGDTLTMGGVDLTFLDLDEEQLADQAAVRTKPGGEIRPGITLMLLTELQLLLGIQHYIAMGEEADLRVPIAFALLAGIMWVYYLFMRMLRRRGVEIETIAFYLCTLGLSVTATSVPTDVFRQLVFVTAGLFVFLCLGFFLRDLERARKLRWPIAVVGVLMLAATLVIARSTNGAKNWVSIAGFSFQPSEFVKICFVFAGATTLDRLFAKRNLIMFMGFSALCVVTLGLMSDFGTALVFFVAYLVIAFLRSGDFATIFLSAGGAGLGGFLILTVKPYVKDRFSTWGKAWQYANESGYQQTRTMAAAASGGLFGVGAGNGWLHTVFAAETDMVFGIVCEEHGLITAVFAVAALVLLAFFAIKAAATARSSFYVIGACAAVSMLLFQIVLNVFGSLDILPFTGVTFPFVSRGGSSIIACWGLLAFIKAVDTRQNASFAIKLPKRKRKKRDTFYTIDDGYDFSGYDPERHGV
jgi:cell division protein FtsW (lipid II flippase)